MNTRKANLKKLRLGGAASSDSRNGRRKATPIISNFFTPESSNTEQVDEVESTDNSQRMLSPVAKLAEEYGVVEMSENSQTMPSSIEMLKESSEAEIAETSLPFPSLVENLKAKFGKTETADISQPKPISIKKLKGERKAESKRATRTKLSTFLPKEKRMKTAAEKPISEFLTKNNDFETPIKNIKVAPKTKAKPRQKKQQKIKSAFFKNEEMFSAVAAQHCLVNNINPDEMQMALALSRSEADLSGVIVVDDEDEEKEGIQDKLKKFGFQIAESADYTFTAFMPTNRKTKWANKFTALTLRNPTRQQEKVSRKVEEFLSTQFVSSSSPNDDEVLRYPIKSNILLPLVAGERVIFRPDASENLDPVDFYVLNLFEPSKTKPGHLLKDVRKIAGRDRSPIKIRQPLEGERLNSGIDPQMQSPAIKKSRYDSIVIPRSCPKNNLKIFETICDPLPATMPCIPNHAHQNELEGSCISERAKDICDPIVIDSPPRRVSMNGAANDCDSIGRRTPDDSKSVNVSNEISISSKSEVTPHPLTSSESYLSFQQLSSMRSTSPDIFADSDVEMETDSCTEMEKLNVSNSSSSGNQITTYEIFSSNEVKTSLDTKLISNDMNHNSLPTVIDLTQYESDSNSQHSGKLISFDKYLEKRLGDDFPQEKSLPDALPSAQSNEIPFTSPKLSAENEIPLHLNGSFFFDKSAESRKTSFSFCSSASEEFHKSSEKANEPKRTSFSFCSSASEEFHKSIEKPIGTKRTSFSFCSSASEDFQKSTSLNNPKTEENSIDLTQNSDGENECILLSDDEVNYSIWKADKTFHDKEEKDLTSQNVTVDRLLDELKMYESVKQHDFSFVDLVANTQPLESQSENLETKSIASSDSFDLDLSKRSDFGILEEQSPFKTPTKTPKKTPRKSANSATTKCRKALSESFVSSPGESSAPLKRFSSTKKFQEFTKSDDDSLSDLDDIDKLIYGSPSKRVYKKPAGLDQLLTGKISAKIESPKKVQLESYLQLDSPKEFEFNGRTYLVRTNVAEKPNYETMDESAVLDQLYKYGLKPLKRKQAVKILEYVYNQTHPCLVDEEEFSSQVLETNNNDDDKERDKDHPSLKTPNFNFKDCWGHVLLSDGNISMEIEGEQYIVQTNTTKKVLTVLLPFHIAWYNLVKSNKQLHEAILHYEPIDLQEIYLFFKSLGYRYDPKELKYFFDSRSIIFRYDLNKSDPSAGANRHVRKKPLKVTKKS